MAILKSDIFHCLDSFERGNQFNSISDRTNLQIYKKIKEPKYQTWPKQNKKSFMYLRRFGLRIFGTPLAAILYLVIKSWTNVAEPYFI